ncbi:hypothetical protein ACZ90_04975 [Streptomyces albus subsp. albus]|nr:hypothetical protein ACZ90_04975 [Streptomyces albus subsp. albus]
MKYEDVIHAPVDKLKTAVDDWTDLVGKLDTMATTAREGMRAKAERAAWEGVNAEVTRQFIRKTAQEFADAAKAAKAIKLLLDDAHTIFKKAKDDLIRIRDKDGPAAGIRVDGHGKVTASGVLLDIDGKKVKPEDVDPGTRHDPDYAAALQKQKEAVGAWQHKIKQIIDTCADADESLRLALTANNKDAHDFTAPKYQSLDQEEADRAAKLLSKGTGISKADLVQLDELLLDNRGNPAFSKPFYEHLGPKKALTLYGQIAISASEYSQGDKARTDAVKKLQRGLGLNLATASHDKRFAEKWGPELRRLGTQQLELDRGGITPTAYGYQLLGGILRYGNYDAKFLKPIAEHVTQLHADDPDFFAPDNRDATYKNAFNPNGKDGAGYDPVLSVLEALGHSPEASKEFFSEPPTLYNRDGSAVGGYGVSDLDGNIGEGYLRYFANNDYDSFADTDQSNKKAVEESGGYMSRALGHALESSTLGRPWDAYAEPIKRDADSAKIMTDVIEIYSDVKLLKDHETISESLGRMGGAYIDDIDWKLDDDEDGSIYAPKDSYDHHIKNSKWYVRNFISALGQHPDSYASLSEAQQIYTTSYLNQDFDLGSKEDRSHIRSSVAIGAELQGHLDKARAQQIQAEQMKALEDYEKRSEKEASWRELGTSSGAAATVTGASFLIPGNAASRVVAGLAVPIASDVSKDLMSLLVDQALGENSEQEHDEKVESFEKLAHDGSTRIFRGGEHKAAAPAIQFIDRPGVDAELRETVINSFKLGYDHGLNLEQSQGQRPVT